MSHSELSKQVADAAQRITGEVFCAAGFHHVPAAQIARTKPAVCKRCVAKMTERRAASGGAGK